MAGDPDPVAIADAERPGGLAMDVQPVLAGDLAQPRILRAPRVVHVHGALGDGVQRVVAAIDHALLEGRVPQGQGVGVGGDARAVALGRANGAMALARQLELLQRLRVDLHDDRGRAGDEAHLAGPVQVPLVRIAVIPVPIGEPVLPEAAVRDVALDLIGVRRAGPVLGPVLAAPARQRSQAGASLVVDDVVGIAAGVERSAFLGDHSRQTQPRAEIQQHRLEWTHVPVRPHHRVPDGVGCGVRVADRPVQQRDAVVAFQVGGVRQDQVGVGDHLRVEGIGVDDPGDPVLPRLRVPVGQHLHGSGRVHRRVPRHVRHVEEQGVDAIGIALPRVVDHHVHQAVGGERGLPGERLVDTLGRAAVIEQQLLGRHGKPQVRPRERRVGLHLPVPAEGLGKRVQRLRVRRLVAHAARHVDGAQQELEDVDGAAGVKAVAVGGDPAHGVHGHGPADHLVVAAAEAVGPPDRQLDGLLEGDPRQIGGDAPDRPRRDSAGPGHPVRRVRVIQVALDDPLKAGHRPPAVRQGDRPGQDRHGGHVVGAGERLPAPVPAQRGAVLVPDVEAVAGAPRVVHHQPVGVGVPDQIQLVDGTGLQELVDEGHHEQPVGAGTDADPFVGDGGVARAHRVDGHEPGAPGLEPAEACLDGVGVMVLGDAEHHEVLRVLPVRLAELPEGAGDGVEAARRHVDGAEPAMGGEVRGAELLRPPAREGLALIAAGEEGELAGVGGAAAGEPGGGGIQRLLPLHLPELARAPGPDPLERLRQSGRGLVVHDPRRPLGAEHAPVHGVIPVALDVADLAALQMHLDAAPACAHVAGGALDLVPHRGRGVDGALGVAVTGVIFA